MPRKKQPIEQDSHLERAFLTYWEVIYAHLTEGLPPPSHELKGLLPGRRNRSDFGWPEQGLLIELEGGIRGGRHTRPLGFTRDAAKYNALAALGWVVLRYTTHYFEGYVDYGRGKERKVLAVYDPEAMIREIVVVWGRREALRQTGALVLYKS